jgi:Holliday junction resolvasome RuvABC endonuclease subunit
VTEVDPYDGSWIRMVGVDPGLATLGVSKLLFDPSRGILLRSVHLVTTKKETKKRRLRQKCDDTRRLGIIVKSFSELVLEWNPHVFAFEDVPTPRSSSVVRKCALAWGALYAVATTVPGALILEYDPKDVKLASVDDKQASKAKIIQMLSERYPVLAEAKVAASKKEHVADAVAVAETATQDPAVLALALALKRVMT